MRFSTIFALAVVLLVFITIQGWLINQKIVLGNSISAYSATIQAAVTEVRSPVWGQISTVYVHEDQAVKDGDELFAIKPQEAGRGTVKITAQSDGVITDVVGTAGQFVQGNEALAKLVNTSPDALYIEATLRVPPESIDKVRPKLLATASADYLNGGEPVQVVVTAVDPQYDADKKTIDVRLRFVDPPSNLKTLTIGVPVTLEFDGSPSAFAGLRRWMEDWLRKDDVAVSSAGSAK